MENEEQGERKQMPAIAGISNPRAQRDEDRLEPCPTGLSLGFALGFAEAGDAVARFPLTTFLEQFESFEALEDVAFTAESGGCAQAAML